MRGLKLRSLGLGGEVYRRLGAIPQTTAPGEILVALQSGLIEGAEFVGPGSDIALGLYRYAPFYYYPGFWEGGPAIHFYVNLQKWNELPKPYQAAIQAAAGYVNVDTQAKYDARNPAALRSLVGNGAQLRPFSQEIMDAAYKAANEVYDEISAKNADFKKIYDSYKAFRGEEYLWFQVAEYAYDTFMIRARARG